MKQIFLFSHLFFLLFLHTQLYAGHPTTGSVQHWEVNDPFKNAVFLRNDGIFDGWGMASSPVLFAIDRADKVQFTSNEVIWNLRTVRPLSEHEREQLEREKGGEPKPEVISTFVKMEWLDANPAVIVEAYDLQPGYYTYAVVNPATSSITPALTHGFHKIVYRNLYPGIDAEYTIPREGGIKYSLIVSAGADLSRVRFRYTGDISALRLTWQKKLEIKSPGGKLTEHAPSVFYESGELIRSRFNISNDVISFSLPDGYDSNRRIVIDPWVTSNLSTLSSSNNGYNVDYDFLGNLFVYGGGDVSGSGTPAYEVAKYDANGNLIWTFNGIIASPSWTSSGISYHSVSNFLVERNTGRTYVGQAYSNIGAQVVRLDPAGLYDNFISNADPQFEEIWDMTFNCINGQIFAIGGGTTSNINYGVVDPLSGSVIRSNITGVPNNAGQDIVSVAIDNSGTMFAVIAGGGSGVNNYLFRVNGTFNGNVWSAPTGFTVFNEGNNKPYLPPSGFSGNGMNALAVNDNYLFLYDGSDMRAYDKNSGLPVGPLQNFPGYVRKYQDGIAVDNCDNIFVGGVGAIEIFHFTGSGYTSNGVISLGPGNGGKHVHDIKYDWGTNRLFVSGENFAGVYDAPPAISCQSLSVASTSNCSGTAIATVTTNLVAPVITYTWYDSSGTVISVKSTFSLLDSLNGLLPGSYIVRVQVNPLCGGPNDTAMIHIANSSTTLINSTVTDPSCNQSANGWAFATASGNPGPFTFAWNTTPVQNNDTAFNLAAGTYICTVTDPSGCVNFDTVTVHEPPPIVSSISGDTTFCPGNTVTLTANSFGGVGTMNHSWNPGSFSGNSITVMPTATTVYTCVATDVNGCSEVSTFQVSLNNNVSVFAGNDVSVCTGDMVTLGDIAQPNTTYQWQPASGLTNPLSSQTTFIATNTTSTSLQLTYSVTAINNAGCSGTDDITITVEPSPHAVFSAPPGQCMDGNAFNFTVTSDILSSVSFSWTFDAGASLPNSNLQFPPPISYSTPGFHRISVMPAAGSCFGVPVVDSIEVWPMPLAEFAPDSLAGCSPLTTSFRNLSSGSNIYLWDFHDGNTSALPSPVHVFDQAGIYDITLHTTNVHGCTDDTTLAALIHVFESPVADFSHSPDKVTILEPEITFTNHSQAAIFNFWDFGDGTTSINVNDVHRYAQLGSYTVRLVVSNQLGCLDTMTAILRVEKWFSFYIPNSFTPNGDGHNDFFQGYGTNLKSYEMHIYDRWGEEIYVTDDYDAPWNGSVKSTVQEGVFVYRIEVSDLYDEIHEYIGKVTLIR